MRIGDLRDASEVLAELDHRRRQLKNISDATVTRVYFTTKDEKNGEIAQADLMCAGVQVAMVEWLEYEISALEVSLRDLGVVP